MDIYHPGCSHVLPRSGGTRIWWNLAVKCHQVVASTGVCHHGSVSHVWMPPLLPSHCPHSIVDGIWDLVAYVALGTSMTGWVSPHVGVPVGRCHPHTVSVADGSGEDGSGVPWPPTVMAPAPSSGLAPTGKGTLWMAPGPRLVPAGTALNLCLLFVLLLLFLFSFSLGPAPGPRPAPVGMVVAEREDDPPISK